ncbi:MAG TPA: hypothetical protein VGL99_33975 [Chloroflexota bacterium]
MRRWHRREEPRQRALRMVVLVLFAAAAVCTLGLGLVLIGRPDETRYGESLIYDHAARLLRGEPLYQPLDGPPYTVANYTPLYYYVVAGLRAVFGPGFAPGRLISLLSGIVAAMLAGYLAGRRTRALWPALAAAALFCGLGLVGPVPWIAAYKEDMLGVALGLACIAVLDVTAATSRFGVVLAALFGAGAFLTKQSLIGPALCGLVWLIACRPRSVPLYAGVVAGSVAATALALEASTGAFLANTVAGNTHQPFDPLTFQHNLGELVTFQIAPSAIALLALFGRRVLHDLLALNWLGSLVPLVPLGALGADYNYWLSFAAASAIVASVVMWEQRGRWTGVVAGLLLGVNAIVGTQVVLRQVIGQPAYVLGEPTDSATFNGLVQRVQATAGTVLADPLDVVVLADRPILLEPILYSLFELDRSWDPAPMVQRVCRGEIALLVLGYPIEEIGQRFPTSVARALRQTMQLERTVALAGRARYVLVPGPRSSGCA